MEPALTDVVLLWAPLLCFVSHCLLVHVPGNRPPNSAPTASSRADIWNANNGSKLQHCRLVASPYLLHLISSLDINRVP